MLLLIPLLPFIGFLINAFFGRRLSKGASGWIACAAIIASFAIAVFIVFVAPEAAREQTAYTWIGSDRLQIPITLRVDSLSALMILVVTGIGSLIHIYSISYMHEESSSEFARYFSYMNLFAAFMLLLVLATSFPVLFVGWEGVGLCSYLLIGFWYKKDVASDAGKKAFVVNRIGDFGYIVAMLLIFATFGTLDFQQVGAAAAARAPEATMGVMTIATLLLFLGATGKSAQIPLHVWLPDAMEGPTPVSALIHAATMVTAGVYLIGRNAVLFSHAPITLGVVAAIGTATALMAGTIGLVQHDIKRVLAYSTVSQLGYMFLAMGVGAYAAGIFHLMTHAFFKALLFLGSGAVIHALAGEQDMRNMGGLKKDLPVTYWTFLIGAIAISGVPPLAGFFSKDEILLRTFTSGKLLLWGIALLTAFLTATYMFRLVFLTFHGDRRHDAPAAPAHPEEEEPAAAATHDTGHGHGGHLHDAPPAMAFALIVLAIGSVLAGFIGVPAIFGGSNRIEHILAPSFEVHAQATEVGAVAETEAAEAHAASASTEWMLTGLSTGVALAGIGIAAFFWLKNRRAADDVARRFSGLYKLLLNKYYVDEAYDATIVQPIKQGSTILLWKGFDAGVIDGTVNGVGALVRGSSGVLRRLQTGSMSAYAGSLFLGVVLILGYYLFR